jgi:hypothetical protein
MRRSSSSCASGGGSSRIRDMGLPAGRGKARSASSGGADEFAPALDDTIAAASEAVATQVWRKFVYPAGTVYIGYMVGDKREGTGAYVDRNKNRFEGQWHNDRCVCVLGKIGVHAATAAAVRQMLYCGSYEVLYYDRCL